LFFAAASQKELLEVSQKALDNNKEHFAQIDGMVKVGTRPEIDLAQARADIANARLALLNAKNGYAVARAKLSQAIGISTAPTFEIVGSSAAEVDGESREVAALMDEAMSARPESAALTAQVKSQELNIKATRGAYLPSLGVQLGGTLASRALPTIVPNLNAQLTLNWALYEGGVTSATEREGEANLRGLEAQRDGFKLQVQLDVQQALLDVASAREGVEVSAEVTAAAQEKLRLAEGRYKAGAGNALELSDAQVAASQASAQAVQAKFSLSIARSSLLAALGRP
jgi:outer membrane protein